MKLTPIFTGFLLALLLHPLCSYSHGHTLDSLYTILKNEKNDTNKVNTLTVLSKKLIYTGRYHEADSLTREALSLSQKLAFKPGIAISYKDLGAIYYYLGDYNESLKNQLLSLKVYEELGDKKAIGAVSGNVGLIYSDQGNYPEALKNLQYSLKIAEETDNKPSIGRAYGNIGNIYYRQGNYVKALKYQLQSLKNDTAIQDKQGIALAYGNIGNVYYSQKNYPEALRNYTQSIEIDSAIGNKYGMGLAYSNIGNVYYDQHNYKEALKNQVLSLKTYKEINAYYGIGLAYANTGNIYYREQNYTEALKNYSASLHIYEQTGDKRDAGCVHIFLAGTLMDEMNFAEAKKYLDSALAVGTLIGGKDIIRDYYFDLAKMDSAKGNYKTAFDDYKNYILYRDSMINDENTKKIVQAQMNYDFEQKETKLKAQQDVQNTINAEKLKRQKLITWSATGISALILLSSLLLFNRTRLKQKNRYQQELNLKQKELATAVMETQEQERKRIAEDLHDSLGHLLSTIRLQLQTPTEAQKKSFEKSLELLQQASHEIHNITFNLMPRTLEEEGLIPALNELAGRISATGTTTILLQLHEVEGLALEKPTQFTIYRIIQEAVNNILKYAESKEINIQLIKQEGTLVIMIEDDGKGFNINEVKKGRGLKNMMARSEWLNGKLAIDSSQGYGTTITIEIPV